MDLKELQQELEKEQANFMRLANNLMSMEDNEELQDKRIQLRVDLELSKQKIIQLVEQIKTLK